MIVFNNLAISFFELAAFKIFDEGENVIVCWCLLGLDIGVGIDRNRGNGEKEDDVDEELGIIEQGGLQG